MARTGEHWKIQNGVLQPVNPDGNNILLRGFDRYFNFGIDSGAAGYGIRDNNGTLQFKNQTGAWQDFGSGSGGSGGTASAAGANGAIQYNDNGSFAGADIRYDASNGHIIINPDASHPLELSGDSNAAFIQSDKIFFKDASGNTTFGLDMTSSPYVFRPSNTNADLGTDGNAWNDMYLDGIAYVDGNINTGGRYLVNGNPLSYNDIANTPDLSVLREIEYADTESDLPDTGDENKVYITRDNGYMFRWNGSGYTQMTDQTAIWGQITGDIANQNDLKAALDSKAESGHDHDGRYIQKSLGAVVVKHGDDPDVARPTGYNIVIWQGSVEPNNWQPEDNWNKTPVS